MTADKPRKGHVHAYPVDHQSKDLDKRFEQEAQHQVVREAGVCDGRDGRVNTRVAKVSTGSGGLGRFAAEHIARAVAEEQDSKDQELGFKAMQKVPGAIIELATALKETDPNKRMTDIDKVISGLQKTKMDKLSYVNAV